MIKNWELTPSQKIIVKDNHRFRVVNCGRKFGKTTTAKVEITGCASEKDNRHILYIAPTIGEARDIMWLPLKELTKSNWAKEPNDTRLEIMLKTKELGISTIFLKGWEAIEAIRGMEFDFIVLDETAKYKNFWSLWQEVVRPTLTPRQGEALFLSTPRGFNFFYDLCNQELKDKDFKTFHFTSFDNPYLPIEELERAKATLPPEAFLQEYMASFQKTQGLVYKEFDRKTCLYNDLPDMNLQKIAGVDFGYVNPAAVLDIRTNGEYFYVEDEWYKTGRTDIQIAEYVAQSGFSEVYPDPESPQAIEELKRKNVNIREVVKGKDSIEAGIKRIKELLIIGKLKINNRCVNLISEFEMYSYDDKEKDINQKEKPIKANDHALDALRYAVIMKQPEKKINQFHYNLIQRPENSTR